MKSLFVFLLFSGFCFADAPALKVFQGAPLESNEDSRSEGTFGNDGVFCEDCYARWAETQYNIPPQEAIRRARDIAANIKKNNGGSSQSTDH